MEKTVTSSKLNQLGAILMVLGLVTDPTFQGYLGELVPTAWLPRIIAAAGLTVMILRTFFTGQPTTLTRDAYRVLAIFVLGIAITCNAAGCVTVKSYPVKPGCETSVFAKYGTELDAVMRTMATSINILALVDPVKYQIAKSICIGISAVLKGNDPIVTIASLMGMDPAWALVLAPLTGTFSFDDPISQCDRDVIVSYLKMVTG